MTPRRVIGIVGILAGLFLVTPPNAHAQIAPTASVLTLADFRADFDQAIGFLDAFSVHKDLNARRLSIDYPARFADLRAHLGEGTNLCGFVRVLARALNLVQDLHVGTMPLGYLREYGKLQSRYNIADDEDYAGVAAVEAACPITPPSLDLPLAFIDGAYVFYADVTVGGSRIPRGTTILSYDGIPIARHIREHLDEVYPVRMTPRGEPYSTRFYRTGQGAFRLGLSDGQVVTMDRADTVHWEVPRTHEISFFSQPGAAVRYFDRERILYIGIPMMDESLVDGINATVDSLVRRGVPIDKVAIDVRGNGGGSDLTWRRVLAHLVGRELSMALDLRMKDTRLARARYRQEPARTATPVALLGGTPYWVHNDNVLSFGPDSTSIGFSGPIYVLRDAYIYSSAANLADFASRDPQLITVGETSDIVGGAQIEPLFFKLDRTGIVFRVEPVLDFAGVETFDDFAHNHVEASVPMGIEDLFRRSTFAGDVFGPEFLRQHDPLFRYVAAQPIPAGQR